MATLERVAECLELAAIVALHDVLQHPIAAGHGSAPVALRQSTVAKRAPDLHMLVGVKPVVILAATVGATVAALAAVIWLLNHQLE